MKNPWMAWKFLRSQLFEGNKRVAWYEKGALTEGDARFAWLDTRINEIIVLIDGDNGQTYKVRAGLVFSVMETK